MYVTIYINLEHKVFPLNSTLLNGECLSDYHWYEMRDSLFLDLWNSCSSLWDKSLELRIWWIKLIVVVLLNEEFTVKWFCLYFFRGLNVNGSIFPRDFYLVLLCFFIFCLALLYMGKFREWPSPFVGANFGSGLSHFKMWASRCARRLWMKS